MEKPLLIAHRGDTKNFPENTIPAFTSAINKGADGVELDVQMLNGVPVVVHNYLFDRALSYPLLSDVLSQVDKSIRFEVEIKSLGEGAVAAIAAVVDQFRPLNLEVTSSVQPLFRELAEHFPNDKRGFIFRNWLLEDWMDEEFKIYWIIRHLQLAQATVLHLDLSLYSPALVTALHAAGITAHAHLKTADPEPFALVKELGIDQCTFDDVAILRLV